MERWIRGAVIGKGSFGTVNLAFGIGESSPAAPLVMAVKSAPVSRSASLEREAEIMGHLQGCPQVLRCLGREVTVEMGGDQPLYNLFLEYAPGGSLSSLGGRLSEAEVRSCTMSILQGLSFVHRKGFVHGDVKLGNVLLCEDGVKIADFGLAKRAGEGPGAAPRLGGTPLYMSPESAARGECEPPSDIWSLGCAVAEMVTGRPPWLCPEEAGAGANALLFRIAFGEELPEIPPELSDEGRDFLSRCFERDPRRRWTADMLLRHPFVSAISAEAPLLSSKKEGGSSRISPRSVLDLMTWDSVRLSPFLDSSAVDAQEGNEINPDGMSSSPSPADRIRQLATEAEKVPFWSDSGDGWITVTRTNSSASRRSGSSAMLERMLRAGGKRERYSDSGAAEFDASTSRSAGEIEESDVSCGELHGCVCRSGLGSELGSRSRKLRDPRNGKFGGFSNCRKMNESASACGFFSSISVLELDSICDSSPFQDEYNQRHSYYV